MTFLTKEELEAYLDKQIADGKMTEQEAEEEWQEWMHRGNDSYLSVYGW